MHQTIDVWSFGCVLSEAATWLVAGYQGITLYRELRKKARRAEGNTSDAFHNGIKVLPAVVDWHKSLRSRLRKTDTLTSLVLDLVENGMLLRDPEERLSAEGICAQLRMIYKRAQAALGAFDDKISEGKTKAPGQLEYSAVPKADLGLPRSDHRPIHMEASQRSRIPIFVRREQSTAQRSSSPEVGFHDPTLQPQHGLKFPKTYPTIPRALQSDKPRTLRQNVVTARQQVDPLFLPV
jgi:serine/threonine protein kinase